jgi:hypothetical protein
MSNATQTGCIHCGTEDTGRFDEDQPVCRDCIGTMAEDTARRVSEDLNEILRKRVSASVGHERWPGDVDPPTVHQYEEALTAMVRQLIENGVDTMDRPPSRDVQIVERDADAPDWIPAFSVYVDGVFKGDCKTREAAEAAKLAEIAAPENEIERYVRILEPLAADPRVKYVGAEHTGGGCMCAAIYFEDEREPYVPDNESPRDDRPYIWITPAEGYVIESAGDDGDVLIGVYDDHASGEWNEELSGQVDEVDLLTRVRWLVDRLVGKVEASK